MINVRVYARTLGWLLSWLGLAAARCEYHQQVVAGETYYVYSPNYPNYYEPGTQCMWTAVTEPDQRITLDCSYFNMPSSPGCSSDHVAVSPSGALSSGDVHNFCGQGMFAIDSSSNKMEVALVSVDSMFGGKFLCTVTSHLDLPPPQPPCNCGIRQRTRIVGGSETGVNEFPMMAGLVDGVIRKLYCGATVVSPLFVVTAAHCLLRRSPNDVAVLVGDHDVTTGSDTAAADLILSRAFFTHPRYDAKTQVNDIALLELSRPMVFSNNVGPACLPFGLRGQSMAGLDVIVLGWGTTEFAGPLSDRLKQTSLRVLDDAGCRAAHPAEVITDDQLCTFAKDTDACQSDSGGPLLYQDPVSGRLFLVGVVSYGVGCATDSPGVNTRVDAFLDWVQEKTQASFCVK